MSDPSIQHHLDQPAGPDSDTQESAEWRDASRAVLQVADPERVRELMDMLSALDALVRSDRIDRALCAQAILRYGIDTYADASWNC